MRRGWLNCADCKQRFHFYADGEPIYVVPAADYEHFEWYAAMNLCPYCGFAAALESWAEYRLNSPKRT